MSSGKKKKYKFIIFLFVFLVGSVFIVFNDSGFLKYMKLKSQVKDLDNQIQKLRNENDDLKSEIDSLGKKIPAKIEKTAREKYDMVREGETAIKIEEK